MLEKILKFGRASEGRPRAATIVPAVPVGCTWCIDDVKTSQTGTTISGWYIRPAESTVQVTANGSIVSVAERERPDLDRMIIGGSGNVVTGFAADLPISADAGIEFGFVLDGTPLPGLNSWYPPADLIGDLPSGDLRTRVHGGDSVPSFLLEGYTAYIRLSQLLDEVLAPDAQAPIRLLDWGVGCARVARYFIAEDRYEVVGTDIDGDNIQWCSDHLPGRFETIPPHPPTVLEPGSFDAIIGVSVMTHLDLDLQLEWLRHLVTLLVPGGVALLTTHGWTTARRAGISDEILEQIAGSGFADGGHNPNIPPSVVEAGYYRNVFNSPEHIREQWGKVMDVESIRPALIGQHQDVVVLRRRASD